MKISEKLKELQLRFLYVLMGIEGDQIIETVIMEFVGVMLVAYTWPSAITALAAATTTTWVAGAGAMWGVLQIMGVIAGMLLIILPAIRLIRKQ